MGKFTINYNSFKEKNKVHDYINYESSCLKIKAIVKKYHNPNEPDEEEEEESNISHDRRSNKTCTSNSNNGTDCTELLKGIKEFNQFLTEEDKGYLITSIVSHLDAEIKKVYLSYLEEELQIFKLMKLRLIQKKQYKSFSLNCIVQELNSLKKLLDCTVLIMKFLVLNMKCLKKICQKIDKHLSPLYNKGSIALKYLRTKLELENSDLSYLLSYKIIDEACAIVDHLSRKLNKRLQYAEYDLRDEEDDKKDRSIDSNNKSYDNSDDISKSYNNTYSKSIINSKSINQSKNSVIDQMGSFCNEEFLLSMSSIKVKKTAMFKEINIIKNKINELLQEINATDGFRIKYENYPVTIRYGFRQINYTNLSSGTQLEEDDGIMTQINSLIDEELIIKKFLTHQAFIEYKDYCKNDVSKSNHYNINLIFVHILFSTWTYVQSIFSPYIIENIDQLGFFCQGLIFLHLGIILSHFVYGFFLKFKKMYKISLMISCLCFIIGQGIILINRFFPHIDDHLNLIIMFLSKFLIGLGSGKLVDRKYIVTYSPRPLLKEMLKKFKVLSNIGLIFGFSLNGFAYFFMNTIEIRFCGMYLTSAIFIIYILLFMIYFTNPESKTFSISTDDNESLLSTRALSLSKRKTITQDESKFLQNANKLIYEESQSFTYNNLNMIQQNIQSLITKERLQFGYIKKAFCAIFFLSFFNSFLPIYSMIQYLMFKDPSRRILFIGTFCFLCVFSYAANFTLLSRVNLQLKHKFIILIVFYQVIFGCIIGLIHFDTIEFYHFSIVISALSICCSCLIDKEVNRLLKKIVPQDFNLLSFNSSLYMTLSESLAIIIAVLTIKLTSSWDFTRGDEMDWSQITLNVVIMTYPFLLSFIIALFNMKNLEPRAIARIYKKNLYQ